MSRRLRGALQGRSRRWLKERRQREEVCRGWEHPGEVQHLPVARLAVHPQHPRPHVSEAAVREMAHLIRFHGLVQPLLVLPGEAEAYWVVDGARRLAAIRHPWLGWPTAPCLVLQLPDTGSPALVAVLTAVHGRSLSYWEQGRAYLAIREQLQLTMEELSNFLRLSQAHIRRCIDAVRSLDERIVQDCLARGWPPNYHLVALAALRRQPELQWQLYRRSREEGWSLERLRAEVAAVAASQTPELSPGAVRVSNQVLWGSIRLRPGVYRPEEVYAAVAQLVLAFFRQCRFRPEELHHWGRCFLRYVEDNHEMAC